MKLPEIKTEAMLSFLIQLLKTPSPTGFTEQAIKLCEETLKTVPGLSMKRTNKGALVATLTSEDE